MSRRYVIGILVVGLLAFGGWALAQQEQRDAKSSPDGGPFVIGTAGQTGLLLQTNTGKTWELRGPPGNQNWTPIKRID
jgi:hypothetical protein